MDDDDVEYMQDDEVRLILPPTILLMADDGI